MVGHGGVGEVGDGVAERGELPVQHRQHAPLVRAVQHEVVQPGTKETLLSSIRCKTTICIAYCSLSSLPRWAVYDSSSQQKVVEPG